MTNSLPSCNGRTCLALASALESSPEFAPVAPRRLSGACSRRGAAQAGQRRIDRRGRPFGSV